jgi:TPR repeat protein
MRKILLAVVLLFSQSAVQAECVYLSIPDECQAEAEKGNAIAQFILGFMYENGEGVSQDYKKAEKWYHKAAEQGDTDAQYNLGKLYDNGNLGVAHDYVMSHMWFTIAGDKGYQDAFNKRDSIAEKMTSSQIQEAQKLAREWMAKHQ